MTVVRGLLLGRTLKKHWFQMASLRITAKPAAAFRVPKCLEDQGCAAASGTCVRRCVTKLLVAWKTPPATQGHMAQHCR